MIWADIFTTEPNTTARFYASLFGWTSRTVTDDGGKYTLLSSESGPVAGVVRGPDRKDKRPAARWVGWFSSQRLESTAASIEAAEGRVVAGPRDVPERGEHLLAVDPEGALFGLMNSSMGDPTDKEPAEGELIWFHLFSYNPEQASIFYANTTGLSPSPWQDAGFVLSDDDEPRAGISLLSEDTTADPTWVPFFLVTDIERKLKVARRLGAKLVVDPTTLENGSVVAIMTDTNGGVFAMVDQTNKKEDA